MDKQNEKRNTEPSSLQENDPGITQKDLLKELYRLEREIDRINRDYQRKDNAVKKIEASQTWKFAKLFAKLSPSRKKKGDTYNKELQSQIASLEGSLNAIESQLNILEADDRQLNSYRMMQHLANEHHKGNLLDYIEQLVEQKKVHMNNYNETFLLAARLLAKQDDAYRKLGYAEMIKGMAGEEIPEFMVREGASTPLITAGSFRGSLTKRMRQKQLGASLLDWELDDKTKAQQFADDLGVRIPDTSRPFTLIELSAKKGVAIKPVDGAGGRGVYMLHNETQIYDIKRNISLLSIEELKTHMQMDLDKGWVKDDAWVAEELIYEDKNNLIPARDLKFYAFYGQVPLVLEIIRYPETMYCWWDGEGNRIETGKYNDQLFRGNGYSSEELEKVSELSKKIPSPFMRIDFLKGRGEMVFGEFTPKPGNYDEFEKSVDHWLGDYFIEAESHLMSDLLKGKKFSEISDIISVRE